MAWHQLWLPLPHPLPPLISQMSQIPELLVGGGGGGGLAGISRLPRRPCRCSCNLTS